MIDSPNPPVEEGEIVEPAATTAKPQPEASAFDINAYNATLEVVRRRLAILEKAKADLKKLNEMYNDNFANDPMYNDADKVFKDAVKRKKDVKAGLAKAPQTAELFAKIKDIREQVKENEETLSGELMEYYRTSGVTEIETEDGDVQEFAIVVKLKSKKRVDK